MYKYNTLDLDEIDKELLEMILIQIARCPHCRGVRSLDSDNKGYHIEIICLYECDLCRLIFDHDIRFASDINLRKKQHQNILFDKKECEITYGKKPKEKM